MPLSCKIYWSPKEKVGLQGTNSVDIGKGQCCYEYDFYSAAFFLSHHRGRNLFLRLVHSSACVSALTLTYAKNKTILIEISISIHYSVRLIAPILILTLLIIP